MLGATTKEREMPLWKIKLSSKGVHKSLVCPQSQENIVSLTHLHAVIVTPGLCN